MPTRKAHTVLDLPTGIQDSDIVRLPLTPHTESTIDSHRIRIVLIVKFLQQPPLIGILLYTKADLTVGWDIQTCKLMSMPGKHINTGKSGKKASY